MNIEHRPTRAWARRLAAGLVIVLGSIAALGQSASATTGTLDASRDVTWPTSTETATMRASLGLTVTDNGASGYFVGYLSGRTYNFVNRTICSRGEIVLRAVISSPSTLRPELNNGWDLVDVRVVAPGTNDFYYRDVICRSNSPAAGFGYTSTNPLRWSASPWRVTGVRATLTTWNVRSDNTVFKTVSATDVAAV